MNKADHSLINVTYNKRLNYCIYSTYILRYIEPLETFGDYNINVLEYKPSLYLRGYVAS